MICDVAFANGAARELLLSPALAAKIPNCPREGVDDAHKEALGCWREAPARSEEDGWRSRPTRMVD